MTRNAVLSLLLLLLLSPFALFGEDGGLPTFVYNPALSPDGKTVAFEYRGDIWTVPFEGGEARRLTLQMARECHPLFSPDGRWIVYSAEYHGDLDLYVIPSGGGEPRRLTYAPGSEVACSFSPDGRTVYFYSTRDGREDIFSVPFEGGTPVRRVYALKDPLLGAAVSPDGKKVLFTFRAGYGGIHRPAFKTMYTSEIYIADNTVPFTSIERLTDDLYYDFRPRWDRLGKNVYFMSARTGGLNIYRCPWPGDLEKDAVAITKFDDRGVSWYDVAADGRIVFTRNKRLYTVREGFDPQPLVFAAYDPPRVSYPEFVQEKPSVTDYDLSPDGKKIVFVAGHDLFVTSTAGGYARRLTATPEREMHPRWAADSKRIVFSRVHGGGLNLFVLDAATGKEKAVTKGSDSWFFPSFAPDGRILCQHNLDTVCLVDLDGKVDVLHKGRYFVLPLGDSPAFHMDPKGRWLYLAPYNSVNNGEARVLDLKAKDAAPFKFSWLGGDSYPVAFTPDGRAFIYNNGTRALNKAIAVVLKEKPKERTHPARKLQELLEPPKKSGKDEGGKAEKKDEPTGPRIPSLDSSALKLRSRPALPALKDAHMVLTVLKDGRLLVMVMKGSRYDICVAPLFASSRSQVKAVTTSPGRKGRVALASDGKTLYYLEKGVIWRASLKGGKSVPLKIDPVRRAVDVRMLRKAVFEEALWVLHYGFYDPALHGADLDYIRARYTPLVLACRDAREFNDVMADVMGEFDASHMGFYGRSMIGRLGVAPERKAHLGFFYDDALMAEKGLLRVSELVRKTPAWDDGLLKVGDYVLAIDGEPVRKGVNVFSLIRDKANKEVELSVASDPAGKDKRYVPLKLITSGSFRSARNYHWRTENRLYVERKSKGRFGYINLLDLMDREYTRFVKESQEYLADYDGVLLDFRYNVGGYVAGKIAEMLDDEPWLFTKYRTLPFMPEDLLRRGSTFFKPTCGLFNYASFSNAEMMCAAYRLKHLGPSVGTPTAGGVIGTGALALVDGSYMRLPSNYVVDRYGRNLERSPTAPEYIVDRDIADIMAGRRPQLDKAMELLAAEVERRRDRLAPQPKETKGKD